MEDVMFGLRAYLAAGAVGLLVAGGLWLYHTAYKAGVEAEAERVQEATERLNEQLRRAEAARREATEAFLRAQRERAEIERRLSDEASEDSNADRRSFGADSVRRIDSIR
ncbi:hypothetical protein C2I36_04665 [Rhodobacteraceae bacterium WD3A24]|nr:hypothetical protein C2I36_04665 [Rhodobacteraceae bacterium WD3A24]